MHSIIWSIIPVYAVLLQCLWDSVMCKKSRHVLVETGNCLCPGKTSWFNSWTRKKTENGGWNLSPRELGEQEGCGEKKERNEREGKSQSYFLQSVLPYSPYSSHSYPGWVIKFQTGILARGTAKLGNLEFLFLPQGKPQGSAGAE